MTVEHSPDDDERIVAAVHDELARWGIDRFDVGAMAHRHGLDVDAIQQRWPDPEVLILEALAHRPGDTAPQPDTGSLRTDLFTLAVRMAAMVTSSDGRKLHGGHLIGDVEIATAEWVAFYNRQRPNGYCQDLTPDRAEALYYHRQRHPHAEEALR